MISGLVVLSNPNKGCYPYLESIKSFIPVCDEIVVVYNPYSIDNSREDIEKLGNRIRIVPAIFDLDKIGWISYGIARTTGYQACRGDIILMFDADGILHEKDINILKEETNKMISDKRFVYGFWGKNRIYSKNIYWDQHKHSGWYKKSYLKDSFDFYHSNGKGIPNFSRIPKEFDRGYEFPVKLYGYEHVFDTKEVLMEKTNRYGKMIDDYSKRLILTNEQYFDNYVRDLFKNLKERGKNMEIIEHPAIIQERLNKLTDKEFGFNFFGLYR